MKHLMCFLIVSLLGTPVLAEKERYKDRHADGIYYGVHTDHVFQSDDEDLNENNDVVVIQHDKWNIGTFENSHFNRSYVVAWEFYGKRANWRKVFIDGRFAVGGATGYVGETFTVLGIAPSIIVSGDLGIDHGPVEYGLRTFYTLPNVINTGLFINIRY